MSDAIHNLSHLYVDNFREQFYDIYFTVQTKIFGTNVTLYENIQCITS